MASLPTGEAAGEVDAIDHRDADAVERRRDGEDERVGVARHDPHGHVHAQGEHPERTGLQEEAGVDVPVHAELDEEERGAADADRDEQQEQLEVAQLRRLPNGDRDRLRERREGLSRRHARASR